MSEPTPPGAFPTTYRDRLAQFKILEEKRFELIEVRDFLGTVFSVHDVCSYGSRN